MKVLLVNRYLYRRGGDATYTIALAHLLQERGHEVVCFGLRAPENDPDLNVPVAVDPIDFPGLLDRGGFRSAIKVLRRTLYSHEAKARMKDVLDAERPDIVHLQNIHHHLSPSVIDAAAERRIPIVWTLHDYSVICPNGNLFSKDRVCEECRPARFHRVIINRCKRGSLKASVVAAAESRLHRMMGVFDSVSRFIAPSRFLAAKLREFDFYPERITHLDNFISMPEALAGWRPGRADAGAAGSGYFLYVGRLIADKGILSLLKSQELWGLVRLKIAGDGPLRELVVEAAARQPRIEYLGHVDATPLRNLLAGALAVLMPSVWYENQPYAVLEAFAARRPVIGSDHGAIPELVGAEERGLLFRPGDPIDLARAVQRLAADPGTADAMGVAGQRFVRAGFTGEAHYRRLIEIYRQAVDGEVHRAA